LSIDNFGDFFAAANPSAQPSPSPGRQVSPFGWQRRLLAALVEDGRWPGRISAPTGAGKTSVIDVHVFALTLMAVGAAPRLPRRLSMVVNRRVLVDDQHEHALALQERLRVAESEIMAEVAQALGSLRTAAEDGMDPMLVTRLRGGVPAPSAWRDDPAVCQIICATPDMWGSRLLMGGYGSTAMARPREAGLLAFDSVVVVDEAHLSRQLVRTAERFAQLAAISDRQLPVPVLQVVQTTATQDLRGGGAANAQQQDRVVDVEPGDLEESPVLRQRLCRPKPVELLELPAWPLPGKGPSRAQGIAMLADRVISLRQEYGPTVGCFVNSVKTATDLAAQLQKTGTVRLVCGRLRPFDLQQLRTEKVMSLEGDPEIDFLISTQSLEVGADLDWAAALVELASGSAVAQRAGRVNRRGLKPRTLVVVAVPASDLNEKTLGPPYSTSDLNASLAWLRERAADPQGLAPWAVRENPPPAQSQRRTLFQRPEFSDTWSWARTSDQLFDTADLDLWLSDDLDDDLDVGIAVRHGLSADPGDANQLIRAIPPRDYEALPVTIKIARTRLDPVSETFPVFIVRDGDVCGYADTDLRPGDVVVIDDRGAIFTATGGIPPVADWEGTDTADDVLEGPLHPEPGEVVVRVGRSSFLDPQEIESESLKTAIVDVLDTAAALKAAPRGENLDSRYGRDQIAAGLEKLSVHLAESQGTRLNTVATLLRDLRLKDLVVAVHPDETGQPMRLLVTDNRRVGFDEEARQQWTSSDKPVTLDAHARAVARRAREIGEQLGLGTLAGLLEQAGLHHDDGKRDPRFQLSLDPARKSGEPLAKSGMSDLGQIREARAASGLPPDWRHEQLSVLACWEHLADLTTDDRELVARLVGTSHGRGRHGFPHTAAELTAEAECAELAERLFNDGEWDQLIEHTHRVIGVWGCAYLEALLRAADGQVSREGS
jgi:CRISPR-associated endonuclease/helicase Cas3